MGGVCGALRFAGLLCRRHQSRRLCGGAALMRLRRGAAPACGGDARSEARAERLLLRQRRQFAGQEAPVQSAPFVERARARAEYLRCIPEAATAFYLLKATSINKPSTSQPPL
jgi:hypothetical protein